MTGAVRSASGLDGPIAGLVAEELFERAIDVVGLGGTAGDAGDEGGGVVDVGLARNDVGVRPEVVPSGGAGAGTGASAASCAG